jgi:phosphoribosylanthranilate isomerase
MPLVKICGLTDAAAVAAAVASGADAIGFVFAESVRRIGVQRALEISAEVPETIKRVAVMMHPSSNEWQEVRTGFRPDVLQTDIGDFENLDVPDEIERWPVLREGAIPDDVELPETFVYEGIRSGSGETVDWRVAAQMAKRGNMILAGGLSIANVTEAINEVAPFGVDVSSGVESVPGKKDTAKIKAFIDAVRNIELMNEEARA